MWMHGKKKDMSRPKERQRTAPKLWLLRTLIIEVIVGL